MNSNTTTTTSKKQIIEKSNSELVTKTIVYVKETLKNAEGGHDYNHIERVLNNSRVIYSEYVNNKENTYKPSLVTIELGALLHDISDYKFNNGDENKGSEMSREFLTKINAPKETVQSVVDIIDGVTFKGNKEKETTNKKSIETQIVQDADRLDALGAIGIARTFNYGGFKNRVMYDPNEEPKMNMSWEEYKNNKSCTLNHFYEKLFLLKDMLNTNEAKKLSEKRNQFMIDFVNRFKKEWECEDFGEY